jgi:hypothetical protein
MALCSCFSYLTARFSTTTAGFGKLFTVIVVVFLILSRTAIAGFCTNRTQLSVQVRMTSHEPSANVANIGAIAAQFNTLSHHLYHVTV